MEELITVGSVHISLRIFFIALSTFNGSIQRLKEFMKTIDKEENFSVFDFSSAINDATNYLKFLNTLSRSSKDFSLENHEKILKIHPELCGLWENHKSFIRDFLLRQCQIKDHYYHGVFGRRISGDNPLKYELKDLQEPIGTAWYPFHSLINHSCASNVMRIYVDGMVILIASRFIANGSQLFDCYKYK